MRVCAIGGVTIRKGFEPSTVPQAAANIDAFFKPSVYPSTAEVAFAPQTNISNRYNSSVFQFNSWMRLSIRRSSCAS